MQTILYSGSVEPFFYPLVGCYGVKYSLVRSSLREPVGCYGIKYGLLDAPACRTHSIPAFTAIQIYDTSRQVWWASGVSDKRAIKLLVHLATTLIRPTNQPTCAADYTALIITAG
jgi:hypothetical protein